MKEIDYLNLIIDSYIDNRKYFQSHLCNRFRNEKENYISKDEFFERCHDIIKKLKLIHESILYNRIIEYLIPLRHINHIIFQYENDKESNLEEINFLIKNKETYKKMIESEEYHANSGDFSFNFHAFKGYNRTEKINMKDILLMEQGINDAEEIIENEIASKDEIDIRTTDSHEYVIRQKTEGIVKDFIIREINNTDTEKGWKYVFKNETEYNIFVDLLANFFEKKTLKLPEEIIVLKRNCKTKFSITLGTIIREFSEGPLKSNNDYFKIIKTLSLYNTLTDNEIYKAIVRV